MTESEIAEIARRQLVDYDAHRPGRIFADPAFRLTIDDAYAIQKQTAALRVVRGEVIGGYKIGCVSEPIQRQLNIDQPVFGHLFATEFHQSGVTLDPVAFECPAIEGELAVRLAEDIPDGSGVPADLSQMIASVFAVIELHNNVFRAATKTAQELIANNAFHAGVVLPVIELSLRDMPELLSASISVFRNGQRLGTAAGNSIPGGPLASVASIIRRVVSSGGRLSGGQILLTGSPLFLYKVEPGDHILVENATQYTECFFHAG